MRQVGRIWMVFAVVLLMVACGGDSGSDDSEDVATQSASTPPPELDMDIGQIIWAEEVDPETGEPVSTASIFTAESPTISAVIEVTDIAAGTEFTAIWTINNQPIEGTEMAVSVDEEMPHAWISFSFALNEDQRYPVGQLGVVITSSEGHVRESSIEIGFP